MLKKLRWRFIIAAMLSFTTVILLIAALVNIVNYYVVVNECDNTIDYIVNYDAYRPFFETPYGVLPESKPFMALPNEEENYMTRFFFVVLDKDGMILTTSLDRVATVDLMASVAFTKEVQKRGNDSGFIRGYRYMTYGLEKGKIIVFLNCTREINYMRSTLIMSLIISAGALLLVFILVILLSGRAIRPFAKNIEIQKRFITDASHELKTPLTSISTSLDVIELDRGEDEWTGNIRQQVGRLTGLVSELVTLSRLDEVKPVPEKEHLDLSGAAWEMAEVYNPQAKASGKEIKTDIQDNVTIVGDKTSIQQMLSVLLDNAVKYSDQGSEIRFSVKRQRGKAVIEVFNTCDFKEIPDEKRLFERFYRPDESRNTSTGGNGIGLAIAKSVAEAHGGRITASCPSGKTMTITVEI